MRRDHLKVWQLGGREMRADRIGSQLADEAVSSGDEEEDESEEESGSERDGSCQHVCC